MQTAEVDSNGTVRNVNYCHTQDLKSTNYVQNEDKQEYRRYYENFQRNIIIILHIVIQIFNLLSTFYCTTKKILILQAFIYCCFT